MNDVSAAPAAATRWRIRPAEPADVPAIHALVRELAEYEREPDAVTATEHDFSTALFGPSPQVYCHVGETSAGEVVGIAVWYVTFSTWRGRHGIWLEDLFVRPGQRGAGMGAGLLRELAHECTRRGYARCEWWVLRWNEPALGFYRSLGATAQDEWVVYRLDGDALADMGAPAEQERGGPS